MVEDQRSSDNMIRNAKPMEAMDRCGKYSTFLSFIPEDSVIEQLPTLKELKLSLIDPRRLPLDLEKDLRSHLVNRRMLPKDYVGGKSESVGKISDLCQVKTCVNSWQDKEHLPLYFFMQKGELKNLLFRTKYPATERLSWEERLQIVAEVAQDPLAFQHNSDKHLTCTDQKPGNILHEYSNKPVTHSNTKPANRLLDGTIRSNVADSPNNSGPDENSMNADHGSNISPVLPQSGNKAKRTPLSARVLNEFEMENQWSHEPPHRQSSSWSLKIKTESQRNVFHLLLLISSLLATITFHTALKYPGGFREEEAYKYNTSPNNFPYLNNWFIAFNSIVFFLSTALLMRLFNELPLGPLLQISGFSMIGAYMCIIMHPLNPCSCISQL